MLTPSGKARTLRLGVTVLDVDTYTLTIDGEVDRPLVLRHDELLAMPAKEQTVRIACAGGTNESTVMKGVTLARLFALARVRSAACRAVFHCADGYNESIPLVEVFHCEAFLGYPADEECADSRGQPLRLVLPGKFGYKWAKTVQRIELVADER